MSAVGAGLTNLVAVPGNEALSGTKDSKEVERMEEEKLKKKYPGLETKASALLQRRLSKNAKYFDSGDYNMAKTHTGNQDLTNNAREVLTGQTIPKPENIPTLRNKTGVNLRYRSTCDEPRPFTEAVKPVCARISISNTPHSPLPSAHSSQLPTDPSTNE
ncbi:Alpha-endosulfine [Clonorchis sinensis]|uniref:Alpha-endosulfine n=2 Tax=Clonorchis sinensis TaxID=79923 RepID=G7YV28_CLOSI|nr:Alpha-endosulfine [Clonorchis sinensis]GAA56808.1 alpha-endosulfine [Clonorchis sinensis]